MSNRVSMQEESICAAAERERLRAAVRNAYSAAAVNPSEKHPFPVGRLFAESVGYPLELLDSLPAIAVEAFAGVSNVSLFASIEAGMTVLDMGCGAGLDSLIASRRVGPGGRVIGIDFGETMIDRARTAADASGASNIDFRLAAAEEIPLADSSVDIALVNGIFNLNPDRASLMSELARVVRPQGSGFIGELILIEPLPPDERACLTNWFK